MVVGVSLLAYSMYGHTNALQQKRVILGVMSLAGCCELKRSFRPTLFMTIYMRQWAQIELGQSDLLNGTLRPVSIQIGLATRRRYQTIYSAIVPQ